MTEAIIHISIPGINHLIMFSLVSLIICNNIFQNFSDTLDIMNQESYSNARQTQLSLPVNENLSEALENEITPDMSVSTSSEFNGSEIPSKFILNMK